MYVSGEEQPVTLLLCSACGKPIQPGQPFIERDHHPLHSESADCQPEETWNPEIDVEEPEE
ncbi:MAG: hypothetical protein P4M01_09400 [Acidobacteriota bacterium]|nr:hypothetical protein [Acidobacteriota bacterium]